MKLSGPVGPQGYKVTPRAPSPSEEVRPSNEEFFPSASYNLPGSNYDVHPEYHQLPDCIKGSMSAKDYAWLPDESKRTLMADMTTPEVGED